MAPEFRGLRTLAASTSREAIIHAARLLFTEQGFAAVTIKDVAAKAGYSPAMVMKATGGKAELYRLATTPPIPTDTERISLPGYFFIRRIVTRAVAGEPEPWAAIAMQVRDAPDSAGQLQRLQADSFTWLTDVLGPEHLDRVEDVIAALVGFATGLRVLGLFAGSEPEELISKYGALVQRLLD